MSQVLYFHNPGFGDGLWLVKDREMLLFLTKHLEPGSWVIYHRPFGPPCGGYYYKLEVDGGAEVVRKALAAMGIVESVVAQAQFE